MAPVLSKTLAHRMSHGLLPTPVSQVSSSFCQTGNQTWARVLGQENQSMPCGFTSRSKPFHAPQCPQPLGQSWQTIQITKRGTRTAHSFTDAHTKLCLPGERDVSLVHSPCYLSGKDDMAKFNNQAEICQVAFLRMKSEAERRISPPDREINWVC